MPISDPIRPTQLPPIATRIALCVGLALIGLIIAGAGLSFAHRVQHGKSDFMGLRQQADLVRSTGSFIEGSTGPYPPSARTAYLIWAALPARVAAALWFTIATTLYTATGWWLIRAASGLPREQRLHAFCIAFLIAGPWIASDLMQGNISSLLMFSVVGSWLLAQRGNWLVAGLVLSLGIILKPVPLVGLLFLSLKRYWRAAFAAALLATLLAVVPATLVVGWERTVEGWSVWYHRVGFSYSPLIAPWNDVPRIDFENGSAIASLMRLLRATEAGEDFSISLANIPPGALAAIWYFLCAALGLPLLWLTRRPGRELTRERQALELAAWLLLMLWLSPLLMSYYLGMTLVPVGVLVWELMQDRAAGRRDRLTLWLLTAFAGSVLHMLSPTLRAAGAGPASLLLLWAALVRRLTIHRHGDLSAAQK